MSLEYTKVKENDTAVVELAKVTGSTPKEVAALVNQQRYRTAYNKRKVEETKKIREVIKQHPELLKEVK